MHSYHYIGHQEYRSSGSLHPLSDEELRQTAPSIFAKTPLTGVSKNYSFLPTIQAVDAMRDAGWQPVWVSEQRVRIKYRAGFQKHMIRFQRTDQLKKETDFLPEVCLVNSHDRSCAYQLHAGLFRLICGNGLIVADTTFERVSIRHVGFEPSAVVTASLKVLDSLPQLTDAVDRFKARRLTVAESTGFANSAIELRYGNIMSAPIGQAYLLQPRRREDSESDLWSTYNRVQENLIRGGLKDYSRRKPDGTRFPRMRAVASLDENVQLNKALWHLAESVAASSN